MPQKIQNFKVMSQKNPKFWGYVNKIQNFEVMSHKNEEFYSINYKHFNYNNNFA